jgi:putative glutamine amidotransferase
MQMKNLNKQKKPIIGITLDWEDSLTYSSSCSWYALRTNYVSCISNKNAIAITIPYDLNAIDDYIDLIDGLIVTGGDYDLSPEYYGEKTEKSTRNLRNNRTEFEMKLIESALKKNKPLLAICAGQQLLCAMHGGTLHQDIKEYNKNALEHEQRFLDIPMSKPSHKITITPNSLLHKITGENEMEVNSSHHQAVKTVGATTIISAISAEDSIIEAIEMPEYLFVLGVEWHPEFEVSKNDTLILNKFIEAARK